MTEKQKDDDMALFQQAMRDVKPLICDKEPLHTPRRKIGTGKRQYHQKVNLDNELSEGYEWVNFTDEEVYFVRSGVQHKILRKLKRNYLNIKIKLDLHGMTVDSARITIGKFLHYCQQRNIRYACIIHGKGYGSQQKQGILKTKVNQWLREHNAVLAFCSAQAADGGTGAVYVLIKRLRQ